MALFCVFGSCPSSNALGGDDIIQSFQLSAEEIQIIRPARIFNVDKKVKIPVDTLGAMYVAVIISAPFNRTERAQERALNVVEDGL